MPTANATPAPAATAQPDPNTPEWERAQPEYQHCNEEQIQMLFRSRTWINIAFASTLGLSQKPKK